ncbi:MAG: hypothetical protein ABFD04_16880 [Syntrophomonas sp.]
MDKKNTVVKMSLHDYEHLKEYQCNYKDFIKEIKSMIISTSIEASSAEITINKEKLGKLLFHFLSADLQIKHLDYTQTVFLYK